MADFPDPGPNSFLLKVGKHVEARASGWGIVGVVAFAGALALIYLLSAPH